MPTPPLFSAEGVLFDLNAGSQKQLFQEISSLLIKSQKLDAKGIACRDIVAAAVER